jgi:hypothetical protein
MPSGAILYPLFDLPMWQLTTQPEIFTTLESKTVTALTYAYNRMATANEQNAFLSDLNHGRTAILASATAAAALDDERVMDQYKLFQNFRDSTVRTGVIERLNDLKPFLDEAIDAVEKQLGMTPEQPAKNRIYGAEQPAGYIGDVHTLPPPPPA